MPPVNERKHGSTQACRVFEKTSDRGDNLTAVFTIDAWRFGGYSVYGWETLVREKLEQKAEATLHEIRDQCGDVDIEFKPETIVGKTCDTVVESVTNRNIDVLVNGDPNGDESELKSPCSDEELENSLPADIEVI